MAKSLRPRPRLASGCRARQNHDAPTFSLLSDPTGRARLHERQRVLSNQLRPPFSALEKKILSQLGDQWFDIQALQLRQSHMCPLINIDFRRHLTDELGTYVRQQRQFS